MGRNPFFTNHDPAGNVIGSVDARGVGTSYAYDWVNDRVVITEAATVPMGITAPPYPVVATMQYHAVGNLIQTTDPRNVVTSYLYDHLNRLVQTVNALSFPSTLPALNHPSPVTTMLYDGDNNVIAVIDPRTVVTSYVYDRLNRPTQVIEAPIVQNGSLLTFGYVTATTYDAADNAVQVTNPRNISTTALYDFRNRLVDETVAAGTPDASRTTMLYAA